MHPAIVNRELKAIYQMQSIGTLCFITIVRLLEFYAYYKTSEIAMDLIMIIGTLFKSSENFAAGFMWVCFMQMEIVHENNRARAIHFASLGSTIESTVGIVNNERVQNCNSPEKMIALLHPYNMDNINLWNEFIRKYFYYMPAPFFIPQSKQQIAVQQQILFKLFA